MVKFKIFLPVTDGFVVFSHFNLHHLVGHPKKPLSCENGTNRSIKCRKMLALSVWQLNRKWSHFELDRCIQHPWKPIPVKPGKINQLQSGKYCTSCLAAKQEVKPFWTSPLIAFSIPRNSLPEKKTQIKSIYDRKMLTLPFWPALTFGGLKCRFNFVQKATFSLLKLDCKWKRDPSANLTHSL